ncbi:MAG: hypothetical protein H6739_05095 [Alphaproteobacteria bacterium]|nr:hypothetical protein [Alphaproteobacteria bacterium]
MLDAYIIERIRQERDRRESGLRPLRIEVPRQQGDRARWGEDDAGASRDDQKPDRGVAIIDFNI